ncbi:MAG: PH domain-containing protein [Defluviitaleaceae bacterium]|nr:PH domain-containing protein [Defluviitaleaceae bacterium]
MYKFINPIRTLPLFIPAYAFFIWVLITTIQRDALIFFDWVVIAFAVIAVIGSAWQVLDYFIGAYIFEKDKLIIKKAISLVKVPYKDITHIKTGKPNRFISRFMGVRDITIELKLDKRNSVYIATNDQEGFLAELHKHREDAWENGAKDGGEAKG